MRYLGLEGPAARRSSCAASSGLRSSRARRAPSRSTSLPRTSPTGARSARLGRRARQGRAPGRPVFGRRRPQAAADDRGRALVRAGPDRTAWRDTRREYHPVSPVPRNRRARAPASWPAGPTGGSMIPAKAFAAPRAGATLEPFSFERRDPGPHDVVLDISHCGVCHTDIHFVNNDFGMSLYPMVPGHEIVGKVAAVGRAVENFKVGDAAGVGCVVDSCRTCPECSAGLEQFCQNGFVLTYSGLEKDGKTVDPGRLLHEDRGRRALRAQGIARAAAGEDGASALRGHHDLLASASLQGREGTEGGRGRAGRPRPHGREVRGLVGGRGHRTQAPPLPRRPTPCGSARTSSC